MDNIEELFKKVEFSEFYNILKDLMNPEENLEAKTEIKSPYSISVLQTYSLLLKKYKMDLSSELVEFFLNKFLINMISHNRKSREEIVEVLKSYINNPEEEDENRPILKR